MSIEEKKIDIDITLGTWLDELYKPDKYTDQDLLRFYDEYQYKGFNRNKVLQQLKMLVPDPEEATQIIIVCALRGPKRAAETKLLSGRTIESYKIPSSGQKGKNGISCQRITAATADLAAFYLKRMNSPKRLNHPCPGFLQFPAAGSILLPIEYRQMHIDFSRQFSPIIGGIFNEQIYQQMVVNAYLNPKLNLFDTAESQILVPHPSPPTFSVAITQSPAIVTPPSSAGRGKMKNNP
jgi:hypothetical protein